MKPRRFSLALVLVVATGIQPVHAQDAPGVTLRDQSSTRETARFLLAPVGARGVGLAGAVTASGADVEGVLWNPASTVGVQRSTAYFTLSNDFGTTSQVVGFLARWNDLRIGLTYYHYDLGSIEARDEANLDLGTLSLDDDALILTGGYALSPSVQLGLNYKLIRLSSSCAGGCDSFDGRSVGHAFDIGTVVRIDALRGLTVGALLRNLGPGIEYSGADTSDPMPSRLRLGASFDATKAFLPHEERFAFIIQGDLQQTVTEFDDLDGYLGVEASLRGILYVRGGYAWSAAGRRGAALGIGLRYDRLVVDVGRAFDDFSSFDTDTPFQLSLAFGF